MPRASTKPPSLDKVVDRITSISTLPEVVIKVLQITKDPHSGVRELQNVVESDPAMTVKLLQTINSAAFAMRNKVTSISQAIGYLGFNKVRDIALTTSVADVFKRECTSGCYRRTKLWHHIVSCAIGSELIASKSESLGFEDAYAAGLLHDLGIILEDQYLHNGFEAMVQVIDDSRSLTEWEQDHFGFDHTLLGARIAEKWRFPESIRAPMRFHHMAENYRGDYSGIVNAVAAANALVSVYETPSVGLNLITPPVAAFEAFHLDEEEEINRFVAELENRISREDFLISQIRD